MSNVEKLAGYGILFVKGFVALYLVRLGWALLVTVFMVVFLTLYACSTPSVVPIRYTNVDVMH